MLKIYCDSARCYLDSSNLDLTLNKEPIKHILTKLHSVLAYEDKNLAFIKMNAKTRWAANKNTQISLYSAEDYSFPRGLLTKVIKHFTYYELAHQVIFINLDKIPQPVSKLVIPDWAYAHQVNIVHHALQNKRCVIQSSTGSGKSYAIGWIISQFVNTKTLIVVPKINLAEQMFNGLTTLLPDKVIKIINGYNKFDGELTDITIAVINSAVNLCNKYPDKLQEIGLMIADECFPKDVEVLTNKGFIKFDSLDRSELVAQFDTTENAISFVKPLRYIEKEYDGKLISLNKQKTLSLTTTPNHDLLVFNKRQNTYVKDTNINTLLNTETYFKTCGFTKSNVKTELNWLDKLLIAYQADGSLHWIKANGILTLDFRFSKQRKIDKFLNIMSNGDFTFTEVKKSEAHGNKKEQRRFLVHNIAYAHKDISRHFNLEELSLTVCKEIIEEMVCWDGFINSKQLDAYYYSSTIKANTDFYQAVALMCNYHTNQVVQTDDRSETFNDVYRLFILKNKDRTSCQNTIKTEVDYVGKVYCVEVPTGNIIVRHNGKVVITGNCHRAATESFKTVSNTCVNAEYRIGLTATPLINNILVQAYVGNLAFVVQDSEMVDKKIIVKPTYICYKPNITYRKTYSQRQEKGETIYLDKSNQPTFNNKPPYTDVYKHSLCLNKGRNNLIVDIVKTIKAHPQRKGPIIVFIEWQDIHGSALLESFAAQDVKVDAYLNGLTTTQERNQIINNLQKGIYDVVLATNVVSEGTDIINLEYAILTDGRKSGSMTIQKIGRVVRKAEDKNSCYVIDIADTEPFYLASAAKNREYEVTQRYGADCVNYCKSLEQLIEIITVKDKE